MDVRKMTNFAEYKSPNWEKERKKVPQSKIDKPRRNDRHKSLGLLIRSRIIG